MMLGKPSSKLIREARRFNYFQGIQAKLSELQEELEKATTDLEKEKEENSDRSSELESLKLVRGLQLSFLFVVHSLTQ